MSVRSDLTLTLPQVPGDGPAGKLLDLLDRHHYRPGHIHLIVRDSKTMHTRTARADKVAQITCEGFQSITTQIFDLETPYLDDDSVFAVKDGLTVKFEPRKSDPRATWELVYDISMAPIGQVSTGSTPIAPTGAW